jgi:hypothetical protein
MTPSCKPPFLRRRAYIAHAQMLFTCVDDDNFISICLFYTLNLLQCYVSIFVSIFSYVSIFVRQNIYSRLKTQQNLIGRSATLENHKGFRQVSNLDGNQSNYRPNVKGE